MKITAGGRSRGVGIGLKLGLRIDAELKKNIFDKKIFELWHQAQNPLTKKIFFILKMKEIFL